MIIILIILNDDDINIIQDENWLAVFISLSDHLYLCCAHQRAPYVNCVAWRASAYGINHLSRAGMACMLVSAHPAACGGDIIFIKAWHGMRMAYGGVCS